CAPTCDAGWSDCDGNPNNGCETQVNSATNCAACGVTCNLSHANSSCSTGTCAPTSGNAGVGNGDSVPSTGCETPLNTTTTGGTGGRVCTTANGSTSCPSGPCVPACTTGFGDCDGNPANGCETLFQTLPPAVNIDSTQWKTNFKTSPIWNCNAA